MRFGRVEGIITALDGDQTRLRLTVYLETGRRLDVVRDEVVAALTPLTTVADLAWHADQYTQETLGVDLAEQGWEVIGQGEPAAAEPGALIRSPSYAVRQLG